jgi:hypothetical protein
MLHEFVKSTVSRSKVSIKNDDDYCKAAAYLFRGIQGLKASAGTAPMAAVLQCADSLACGDRAFELSKPQTGLHTREAQTGPSCADVVESVSSFRFPPCVSLGAFVQVVHHEFL